jgi:hypothetical protein
MDESQRPTTDDFTPKSVNLSAQSNEVESQDISVLSSQLNTGSEKRQLQVMSELAASGEAGLAVLREFLLVRQQSGSVTFIEGKAYEILLRAAGFKETAFLQTHFPAGIVPLRSQRGIDYQPLQKLLAERQFQAADQLTLQKMCELAGLAAVKRKWLYFTEVDSLPTVDLQTINQLWLVHSEGKFGFSVQRQIWLGVGRNWDALWPKIGWKTDKKWTRYPQEFIWNITAPRGHLPLSNQLRGVQVINALLCHPAWSS